MIKAPGTVEPFSLFHHFQFYRKAVPVLYTHRVCQYTCCIPGIPLSRVYSILFCTRKTKTRKKKSNKTNDDKKKQQRIFFFGCCITIFCVTFLPERQACLLFVSPHKPVGKKELRDRFDCHIQTEI